MFKTFLQVSKRKDDFIAGECLWLSRRYDTGTDWIVKRMDRMKNSRNKGARYERELARAFRAEGYEQARRGQQYSGANGDADVVGLPGIHKDDGKQVAMDFDKNRGAI